MREVERGIPGSLAAADTPGATSGVMIRPSRSGKVRICAAVAICLVVPGCNSRPAATPAPVPAPRAQNPSPMVESARAHNRVPSDKPPGIVFTVDSILPKPVEVFIPDRAASAVGADERTLLVHLFGASFVPMHAVADARDGYALAVVNLGAGSAAYEKPFSDSTVWTRLVEKIREEVRARTQDHVRIGRVEVSAFSAGYGGVRALLGNERNASSISGVILLDGLHTSYVPERTVLAEGGTLDTTKLVPFLRYAKRAVAGEVSLTITHSEIFPGTFASTTETTDWLVRELGLKRSPVLAWGPNGMQQISEVRSGRLLILGFAGNTGPDHIDHLHGLPVFLRMSGH